ncbi:hypothetical protein KSS87_020941 [Heliosperma pusillum]|nr:hypothetical protein KSS87_020941 [Heliosperma pusillum]
MKRRDASNKSTCWPSISGKRDRDHVKQSQDGSHKVHLQDGVSRVDRDEDVFGLEVSSSVWNILEVSGVVMSKAFQKVTRLREYQGVDPHFDKIARQYHDIVKKLENMQWTIHQVEMDLKRLPEHSST